MRQVEVVRQNFPNKLLLLRQLELLIYIKTAHLLQHGDGVLAVIEFVKHDIVLLLSTSVIPGGKFEIVSSPVTFSALDFAPLLVVLAGACRSFNFESHN